MLGVWRPQVAAKQPAAEADFGTRQDRWVLRQSRWRLSFITRDYSLIADVAFGDADSGVQDIMRELEGTAGFDRE